MEFFVIGLAFVLIVAIALYAVGDAVGKTAAIPDQIVFDVHEAIEFCAQALPQQITAELSYDELRRLLRFHLEWIQALHWSPESKAAKATVFDQFDATEYILERAAVCHLETTEDAVDAIIVAHLNYLEANGALHLERPEVVKGDLKGSEFEDLLEMPALEDSHDNYGVIESSSTEPS